MIATLPSISPTAFLNKIKLDKGSNISNAMASAFFVSSISQLKGSRKSQQKLTANLKQSVTHNNKHLEVIQIKPCEQSSNCSFYAHSRDAVEIEVSKDSKVYILPSPFQKSYRNPPFTLH